MEFLRKTFQRPWTFCRATFSLPQGATDLFRESGNITCSAQPPVTTLHNRFLNPTYSGGHHRNAGCPGLEKHSRQSFPMRCEEKRIEYFHRGGDISPPTCEMHSILESTLFHECHDGRTQFPVPNQHKSRTRHSFADSLGYSHEVFRSLLGFKTGDRSDQPVIRACPELCTQFFAIGRRQGGVKRSRIDAGPYH